MIDADTPDPSFSRHDDLAAHAQMLKQELSGKPQLLLYHAVLIVLIRRDSHTTGSKQNIC